MQHHREHTLKLYGVLFTLKVLTNTSANCMLACKDAAVFGNLPCMSDVGR